jgi:prepilin-type N-terminal cleavage/methylation domain-containing protein
MTRQSGFTLIELLAAMTAGSLLLVSLSVAVAQLGWQLGRPASGEAAQLEAFAPVFRSLIEQAQPGEKENAFAGEATRLSALVEPPMAAALAGSMRLELSARAGEGGQALYLRLVPTTAGASLPPGAAAERMVAGGFRSIRFAYAGEAAGREAGLPKLVTLTFESADGRVRHVSAAPRIDSGGSCRFDPISMACR